MRNRACTCENGFDNDEQEACVTGFPQPSDAKVTAQRQLSCRVDPLNLTATLLSTFLRADMFRVKTLPIVRCTGAGFASKRLISSRKLRSTVTSAPQDVNSYAGAQVVTDRLECGREPGRPGGDVINTGASGISINFDQTREAYRSKDSLELLRSLVVFKLCSYDFLVDKNKEVMVFPRNLVVKYRA